MMCKYLLIAACSIWVGSCSGQDKGAFPELRGWKLRSDNYGGVITGAAGAQGALQTVNGLYKGPWFVGIGAGLDYYHFRSVPLFLSVTRELGALSSRSGLFLFVDGGVNLPWYKRVLTPYEATMVSSSQFHAGLWGSGGLGFRWRISARTDKALLFSVGYSVKKLRETVVGAGPCDNCVVQATQETYYYKYLNETLVFMVGFRF